MVCGGQPGLRTDYLTIALGHEGMEKTLHRLQTDFHVPGARALVWDFIRACTLCQRHKSEHLHPTGLLHPLEVPSSVWSNIALDFIKGFPRVNGKTVILTVVGQFSKYAHFVPLGHPYTTTTVAKAFFDNIVQLHDMPTSMVSDRDPVFTGHFWQELFKLFETQLHFSSAFHPQSDGQSEATNHIITMYLRCLSSDIPRQWLQWLPWAEYCYNTTFQSSMCTLSFRVVYGRDPPSLRQFVPGEAMLPAMQTQMASWDEFLAEIKERLEQAQHQYKKFYDTKHREVEFAVGQWVWLRLIHRPITSLDVKGRGKLGPKFYGPFKILERIGDVAYKPQLPAGARIHDVFHVGLLKKFHGEPPSALAVLPPIHHGRACLDPEAVTQARLARGRREILVHWKGQAATEASWMELDEFWRVYPTFQLVDELCPEGGRDVMSGIKYSKRPKQRTPGPATGEVGTGATT
jgi:hypothetical protein